MNKNQGRFYHKGNELVRSKYFRDIFNQAGLLIIAQLIPVIFSPLISRIYDENAMAEITGLMTFGSMLLVFSTFKLENAIVIEKKDKKALQLVTLSLIISGFFSIIIYLLILLADDLIINVFKIDNVLFYVPPYILFFSFLNILNFWFVRKKKFKMKAFSKIIENGIYILSAIVIYFISDKNDYGLAVGKMVGVFGALLVLYAISRIRLRHYNIGSHIKLLGSHRDFPIHYMPSSFINIITLQILVIFVGAYFTKEQLGYFGLANMVILLPISFITQSVGTIFFQKTSECMNKGKGKEVKKVFYQTLGMLSLVGVPAFLLLHFGSGYLFPLIFGENWIVTGEIAELLAIVFLFQIMVGPISIVLISLKRIRLNALWQYGRFALIGVYMLVLIYIFHLDFLSFIKWYAYGSATIYFTYFLIINHEVRKLKNEVKSD